MQPELIEKDLVVIGGGLAGICAAVAAGRLGLAVALVTDRPVLGGNSSSEIRVSPCGAASAFPDGHHLYARETGIIEEIKLTQRWRNPEGNAALWDMVLLDLVTKEQGVQLFLNTAAGDVEMAGSEIRAVAARQLGSGREFRFEAPVFADCSGDGFIGAKAGAEFRMGREAKSEFHEEFAPEAADAVTMGSSILFYTKTAGKPVAFIRPDFAYDPKELHFLAWRKPRPEHSGSDYWWIEYGGVLDTIADHEAIRDELWRIVYGIWDYIKNSGRFAADNYTLEWVGAIPGKRESRRLMGDHILKEADLLTPAVFPDAVAYGGWPVDLHPQAGVYDENTDCVMRKPAGIYDLPLRCLYSKNIDNLMFAGRDISVSHVTLGSTRVMNTCALLGQAVGTAAWLCAKYDEKPRAIKNQHLSELQQQLILDDSFIIGRPNQDSRDLARQARISAGSQFQFSQLTATHTRPLQEGFRFMFPDGRAEYCELCLDSPEEAALSVKVCVTERPENSQPQRQVNELTLSVPKGKERWVRIPLALELPAENPKCWLEFCPAKPMRIHLSHEQIVGAACFDPACGYLLESALLRSPALDVYAPQQVASGYHRPYGRPNLWLAAPSGEPEYLELAWQEPQEIKEVVLRFNTDLNFELLAHRPGGKRTNPELVKRYSVEAQVDGRWQTLLAEDDNFLRTRRHSFPPVETGKMRILLWETYGSLLKQLYEVRIY